VPTKLESTITSKKVVDLGKHGSPQRLPLPHVVGAQGQAHAAPAQLGQEREHGLVSLEPGEVTLAELGELDALPQLVGDAPHELGLGDFAAFEGVQGVLAGALGGRRHRPPEVGEGGFAALGEGVQRVHQRRGQHAAEVADDRAGAHAASGAGARTASSYWP